MYWRILGLITVVVAGIVAPAVAANTPAPAPSAPSAVRDAVPAPPQAATARGAAPTRHHQLSGQASWYGGKFQGRLTANGEIFDTNQLTAAHRTLPFDTIVRVTSLATGQSVVVRINDRGPFVDNRVIDLSRAAADIIGLTAAGVAPVELEILHYQPASPLRTLQIASFGSYANANALVARLTDAGFTPAIETVADAGIHRVIIQGVHTDEVAATRTRLAQAGYPDVLVRSK